LTRRPGTGGAFAVHLTVVLVHHLIKEVFDTLERTRREEDVEGRVEDRQMVTVLDQGGGQRTAHHGPITEIDHFDCPGGVDVFAHGHGNTGGPQFGDEIAE
jgi:hypothetical protein